MIIVISPHSDDSIISLGSTLYKSCLDVKILTPFNVSTENVLGIEGLEEVTERRRSEDRSIRVEYGFQFRYGEIPDTSVRGVDWQDENTPLDRNLLKRAAVWISEELEDAKYICFPASIGKHPDHVIANRLLPEIADRIGSERIILYCEEPYMTEGKTFPYQHVLDTMYERIEMNVDQDLKRAMLREYPSQLTPERVTQLSSIKTEKFYVVDKQYWRMLT